MNQEQRKIILSMMEGLEEIADEEESKFDNAPENLQFSDRFEKIVDGAESIREAISILEDVIEWKQKKK